MLIQRKNEAVSCLFRMCDDGPIHNGVISRLMSKCAGCKRILLFRGFRPVDGSETCIVMGLLIVLRREREMG
jgi:hypothetical protein